MPTIKLHCQAAAEAGRVGLETAADAVRNGVQKTKELAGQTGQAAKNAAQVAGTFLTNPEAQRTAFGTVRHGVDKFYDEIQFRANWNNVVLETTGEKTLRTPIKAMEGYKPTLIAIKETDSTNTKAAKKVANALKNYHAEVVVRGERYSRVAGDKAHALTRAALFPIRFVAKLLQIEVAGALIQNSVALAVGFAVRGLVLALSQLAHLAPYAAAAAVLGGVGVGLAAIAAKVSPLVAVAIGLGLVLLSQQAQIAIVSRDVHKVATGIHDAAEAKAQAKAQAKATAELAADAPARAAEDAILVDVPNLFVETPPAAPAAPASTGLLGLGWFGL